MDRTRLGIVALGLLVLTTVSSTTLRADEQFLASLSKLCTREIRKQVREKRFDFSQGPLSGHVQAVEPDSRLEAELKDFQLANDLLTATLAVRGRLRMEGRIDQKTDLSAVVDVRLTVAGEARFVKEGDKFFVEPKVHDLEISVEILDILPVELENGAELISNLAQAYVKANKDKIIAEINKRLGKRPF